MAAKRPLCVVLFWPGGPTPPALVEQLEACYEQVVHMDAVAPTVAMLRALSTSRKEPFVLGHVNTAEHSLLLLVRTVRAEPLLSAISVIGTGTDPDDAVLSPLVLAGMTAFVASPIAPVTARTLWTMVAAAAQVPSNTPAPTLFDRRPSISPLAAAAAAAAGKDKHTGSSPNLFGSPAAGGARGNRSLSVTERDRPAVGDKDASSVNHLGPVERSIIKLFTHYAVPLVQITTPFPHVDLKDKTIRKAVSSWDFRCLSLSDEQLMASIFHIFDNLKLFKHFRFPLDPFKRFLLAVRANYLDNPYHNFRHAVDVLQSFQFLLCRASLASHLQPLELLGLAIAALCHDLAHPGLNNFFQINARTPLALLYNNKSVLENLHSSLTFTLLVRPDLNFLASFTSQEFTELRHMIISAILSTDMALHFDFVKSLKERGKQGFTMATKEEVSLMASSLIKAADISNVARPFPVAKSWAQVLLQEFTNQSQTEAELGYPILPYGREDVKLAKSQEEFIKFVALPFFSELEKFSSAFASITAQILQNVELWQAQDAGKDINAVLKEKKSTLTLVNDLPTVDEDSPATESESDTSAVASPAASLERLTLHRTSTDNSKGSGAVSEDLPMPESPVTSGPGGGGDSGSGSSSPITSLPGRHTVSFALPPGSPTAIAAVLNSAQRAGGGRSSASRRNMHRRVKSDASNDVIAFNSLLSGWRAPVAAVNSGMHSVDGGVMDPESVGTSSPSQPNLQQQQQQQQAGALQSAEQAPRSRLSRHSIDLADILSKRRYSLPVVMLT